MTDASKKNFEGEGRLFSERDTNTSRMSLDNSESSGKSRERSSDRVSDLSRMAIESDRVGGVGDVRANRGLQ